MVWSNQLPQTELILPENGVQAPGTGTIYIGPNLPAELIARGATAGIVWWSPPTNPTYKYLYLCDVQTVDPT